MEASTEDEPRFAPIRSDPDPGLVVVWTRESPALRVVPLDRPLTLGRTDEADVVLDDVKISRRHATVARADAGFVVTDLESRNGTFVDGRRIVGSARTGPLAVLRIGQVVLLLAADVRSLRGAIELDGERVLGPRIQRLYATIADAARSSRTLLVCGPTGAGKELAARHFHRAGPRSRGPFVAVNCASIPPGLAERVLFGTVRGAYSGADSNAEGYVQAADGGVLFLDEIGELDLELQAKLLRFLETREVYPVGATRPRVVDVQICSATHRDLRAMVGRREFREDLYFRIGRPQVLLPALRGRPEEIPWLVAATLRAQGLTAHPLLVEACLLRLWPGNIRELVLALRAAGIAAQAASRTTVEVGDLDADAGLDLSSAVQASSTPRFQDRLDDEAAVLSALRREYGNVQRTADALGVHRTQLRRWLLRHGLDAREFRS